MDRRLFERCGASRGRGAVCGTSRQISADVELIQNKGLEQVREPYVKHLEGRLWEMRLSGPNSIARVIYVAASGRRLVVLHAFVKKSERTPRRALEIARMRAREVV